jgi:single-strand DNA-binding protein
MTGETSITVLGNLTADPEPHLTPAGALVARFTIASTPRSFDRAANEWRDGDTLFLKASAWGETGKNVLASLGKGTRVVAHGVLKARTYEAKDGHTRTVQELDIEEVGISLRYNPATPHRAERASRPAAEPARRRSVDELRISARAYDDEDAWFGTIANPGGVIAPGTPEESGGEVERA